MIEIPEAIVLARQLGQTLAGKRIASVVAAASPHKFAWYFGDPAGYDELLRGRTIGATAAFGGRVELEANGAVLQLGEGAIPRYYEPGAELPAKHQLLVAFEDGSALVATVAMYGGLWAFPDGAMDDEVYYAAAKHARPPLSNAFDRAFFGTLLDDRTRKLSAKAFLATEQRIPGLGNGVLQDILLNARIHPKRKMNTLSDAQLDDLFAACKSTLAQMVAGGGRDTERDLFGDPGGYATKLSKNNALMVCPDCGGPVRRQAYLGGNIYFCEHCQGE